jgi:hypothetical protein
MEQDKEQMLESIFNVLHKNGLFYAYTPYRMSKIALDIADIMRYAHLSSHQLTTAANRICGAKLVQQKGEG